MIIKCDEGYSNDVVLSFLISENIRGRFACINKSLNYILSQHKYPEKVCQLIAEAILLSVMIGQAVKLKWKLSLQIRGSGPIKLVAVDYFSPKEQNQSAHIRAYAQFDYSKLDPGVEHSFSFLGKGFFSVLIDQGVGTEPYQGITPLVGNSLVKCAEAYFEQSEQLPTTFKICVRQLRNSRSEANWRGGGVMLQQLPTVDKLARFGEGVAETNSSEKSTALIETVSNDFENWSRAKILITRIKKDELVGSFLKPRRVLTRLFDQDRLIIFKPQALKFGCSCSVKKVIRTLSIYSAKDIAGMTTEEGTVTADCQFCGKHYILDPSQLGFDGGG